MQILGVEGINIKKPVGGASFHWTIEPLQKKRAQWDDAIKRAPVKPVTVKNNENVTFLFCSTYWFEEGYSRSATISSLSIGAEASSVDV